MVCMIETLPPPNTPLRKKTQNKIITQTRKKVQTVPKGCSFPITPSSHPLPQHLKAWYWPEVLGRVSRLLHICWRAKQVLVTCEGCLLSPAPPPWIHTSSPSLERVKMTDCEGQAKVKTKQACAKKLRRRQPFLDSWDYLIGTAPC